MPSAHGLPGIKWTMKRGGKLVGTVTRTISADGKTMTICGKVTTPEGNQAT